MISKLIIYDNYCQIEEESDYSFLNALDGELSFFVQGAQYSQAFKSGRWDGRKKLLRNDLTFSSGLLDRVQKFHQKHNKRFEVIDKRSPLKNYPPIDILPRLKELGKEPYDYQLEVLEKTKDKRVGIIRVATGGGKSNIATLITAHFGRSTIIYVPGRELLHQTHAFFAQVFDCKVGKIGDGILDPGEINIVSCWIAGKSLGLADKDIYLDTEDDEEEADIDSSKYDEIKKILERTKVHIFDECQILSCDTVQTIVKNIKPEIIYGMSASPFRDSGDDLLIEASLGHKLVDISASYLIERGYLAKPYINFITVPKYPEKLKKHYQSVYQKYIINNEVRNNFAVEWAQKLVKEGRQTLILFNNIKHGKILYDLISPKVPCEMLSGKDSGSIRDAVKEKLQKGEVKCILASRIYDVGIDLPSLSGLLLMGGGKSSVKTIQRIGRVIRKAENKVDAQIVEFFDQAPYLDQHSKIRRKIYESEPSFCIIEGD